MTASTNGDETRGFRARIAQRAEGQAVEGEHVTRHERLVVAGNATDLDPPAFDEYERAGPFGGIGCPLRAGGQRDTPAFERIRQSSVQEPGRRIVGATAGCQARGATFWLRRNTFVGS